MREALVILGFLALTIPCSADVIYVKEGGTGSGTSWADAYGYLQDGLNDADPCDVIWVAEGTYYPTSDYGLGIGDRGKHFRMINDVAIYGGFPDTGDSDMADRDPNQYETILSGDIGTPEDPNDNCYHVFYHPEGANLDTTAILDGFTITAGNANVSSYPHQYGGGLLNFDSGPTLTNCAFIANSATEAGGGMASDPNSSLILTNCTFSGNSADYGGGALIEGTGSILTGCRFMDNWAELYGGGLLNYDSGPTVTNCMFTGNSAEFGGGMYNWYNSNPTLTNCIFTANSAGNGGGMRNWANSDPNLTNCMFTGNLAYRGGGMSNGESSPRVTNCIFSGNRAEDNGGGMSNGESSPSVTDCMFSSNWAGNYGGGMFNYSDNPIVTNCTFTGNSAYYDGGGMCNEGSSPTVTSCTFSSNWAGDDGGGIVNDHSSPTVTNCTFSRNSARGSFSDQGIGGGIDNLYYSNPIVTNCMFTGNSAEFGGGMSNGESSDPTVTNCIFSGNSAEDDGGGMGSFSFSNPVLRNCTFSGNSASSNGGGLYYFGSSPQLANCILWANSDIGGVVESSQIYTGNMSVPPVVSYCCIQGLDTWSGNGNIGDDPLFVDPNGEDGILGTEDDNLRLLEDSPCIDAGDSNSVPSDLDDLDEDGNTTEPMPFDIDRLPRFYDDLHTIDTGTGTEPVVDMGAHEFISCDFEPEGDVDEVDFVTFILYWLDNNCGRCGGADLTGEGNVDISDFARYALLWLAGR